MPSDGLIVNLNHWEAKGPWVAVPLEGGVAPDNGCIKLNYDLDGATRVRFQDSTTPSVDLLFIQALGAPTVLTNDVAIDDRTFEINSLANFIVGTYVGIFSGVSGERRFYFGHILEVGNPTANSIMMDTPIDFAFMAGDIVLPATHNLNVVGTPASPAIFGIQAGGPGGNPFAIDITRIMIEMTSDDVPNFNAFGDIEGGLTNGIVLRRIDGQTRNVWNVKTNAELANLTYDYTPLLQSNPGQGVNGIIARFTFAGTDKHGVALRLFEGDVLQLLIQDDLSSLLSFHIIAQGHIVEGT